MLGLVWNNHGNTLKMGLCSPLPLLIQYHYYVSGYTWNIYFHSDTRIAKSHLQEWRKQENDLHRNGTIINLVECTTLGRDVNEYEISYIM